ncbi:MAG: LON peptidase substrate-binding domain-containing protein [Actinomycetota bacterium]|nr:LON peptidase substrate-binding domain-containing protein [Actinomycetota bacterium]
MSPDHDEVREVPMFPLGTVLLPGGILPLHIFEDRYRELTDYCLKNETQFGVVLIERGHEVGGGDVRASVGCLADIIQHEGFPDGRSNVVVLGTSRINIKEWKSDDPYPTALVSEIVDTSSEDSLARGLEVLGRLCMFLEAAQNKGYKVPPVDGKAVAVGVEIVELTYRIAELTPSGPFDRQRLLAASSCEERLDIIEEQLQGLEEILSAERDER